MRKGQRMLLYTLYTLAADRLRREDGASAVEYGIMVALIALAIGTAVTLVGTNLEALFNTIAGCVASPSTCVSP